MARSPRKRKSSKLKNSASARDGKKNKGSVQRGGKQDSANSSGNRLAALDTLRGFAIILMILDHVAFYFFDQLIELGSVRLLTRLSMPLFCVLSGYLTLESLTRVKGQNDKESRSGRKPFAAARWKRLIQVAIAALIVNAFYYPTAGNFEILVSLLICYLLVALTGAYFALFFGAFLLFSVDKTAVFLDYPLSIVATCVAAGVIFSLKGARLSLACTTALAVLLFGQALLATEFQVVTAPSVFVLLFSPVAVLLLWAATKWKDFRLPLLEHVGRYPLTTYTLQYVVILWFSRY